MRELKAARQSRLTTEERRSAILAAARGLFAEKGIHGATTRELAEAAGISEALMLRHFPTKDALYAAVLEDSCAGDAPAQEAIARLMTLEPSASSLVLILHFLFTRVISDHKRRAFSENGAPKLMMQSLQGDGEFARSFLKGAPAAFVSKVEQCLKAAIKSGDAVETPVSRNLRGWFAHHLAVMVMLCCLPKEPVVDYGVEREKLAEQAATFALRGMGLKDEAIRRWYNPKALALLTA